MHPNYKFTRKTKAEKGKKRKDALGDGQGPMFVAKVGGAAEQRTSSSGDLQVLAPATMASLEAQDASAKVRRFAEPANPDLSSSSSFPNPSPEALSSGTYPGPGLPARSPPISPPGQAHSRRSSSHSSAASIGDSGSDRKRATPVVDGVVGPMRTAPPQQQGQSPYRTLSGHAIPPFGPFPISDVSPFYQQVPSVSSAFNGPSYFLQQMMPQPQPSSSSSSSSPPHHLLHPSSGYPHLQQAPNSSSFMHQSASHMPGMMQAPYGMYLDPYTGLPQQRPFNNASPYSMGPLSYSAGPPSLYSMGLQPPLETTGQSLYNTGPSSFVSGLAPYSMGLSSFSNVASSFTTGPSTHNLGSSLLYGESPYPASAGLSSPSNEAELVGSQLSSGTDAGTAAGAVEGLPSIRSMVQGLSTYPGMGTGAGTGTGTSSGTVLYRSNGRYNGGSGTGQNASDSSIAESVAPLGPTRDQSNSSETSSLLSPNSLASEDRTPRVGFTLPPVRSTLLPSVRSTLLLPRQEHDY